MKLSTEMTPRSWRMISYCVIGFVLYGLFLLHEIMLNIHLNRIDQQMKNLDQEMRYNVDPSSPAAPGALTNQR